MATNRRQFLKNSALAGAAATITRKHSWALPAATTTVSPALSTFQYSEVQLLEGPLREQFDRNHDLFLHLNEDALLKPFRQREGLPAPGPDMGGWYDDADDFDAKENFHGFIPGH